MRSSGSWARYYANRPKRNITKTGVSSSKWGSARVSRAVFGITPNTLVQPFLFRGTVCAMFVFAVVAETTTTAREKRALPNTSWRVFEKLNPIFRRHLISRLLIGCGMKLAKKFFEHCWNGHHQHS